MGLGLILAGGGCAHSAISQSQCTNSDNCNPGFICDNGVCVEGVVDAGTWDDAFYIPPSDAQAPDSSVCGFAEFPLSETEEHIVIPEHVTYMHVKAWGSGGNGEGQCSFDDGGIGGYSEGVFSVTPGDSIIVIVGAPGSASYQGSDVMRFGFGSSGGGGLSGVFKGSDALTELDAPRAYIIAGGAGGAGVGPSGDRCRPGGTGNHPNGGNLNTMLGGIGLDDGVNGGGDGYNGGAGGGRAGVWARGLGNRVRGRQGAWIGSRDPPCGARGRCAPRNG